MARCLVRFTVIVALAASSVTVGCGSTNAGPPGPTRFQVEAADVSFVSSAPAELIVALGSTGSDFQFAASAGGSRGLWNARAKLTRDQALAGRVTLDVTSTADTLATVRIDGSRSLAAASGQLDVSFGQGRTSGTVTGATPDLLDSTFAGEIVISCWVPASAAPAGGAEMLVLDPMLETEACLPFRVLQ